jgi:hypothetical protein
VAVVVETYITDFISLLEEEELIAELFKKFKLLA